MRYRFAEQLYDDPTYFEEFIKRPFWQDRTYKMERKNALRYAMLYQKANGHTRMGVAAAYLHANALFGYFFRDIPVAAIDIPVMIVRDGGLVNLMKALRRRKNTQHHPADADEVVLQSHMHDSADLGDDDTGKAHTGGGGKTDPQNQACKPQVPFAKSKSRVTDAIEFDAMTYRRYRLAAYDEDFQLKAKKVRVAGGKKTVIVVTKFTAIASPLFDDL